MIRTLSFLTLFLVHAAAARAAYARDCNVRNFGATGKGDVSRAFQRAIDACARSGGRVYVPSGRYISGPLDLRTGSHIYLEAGAVLSPSLDPKVWQARAGKSVEDTASVGYGKLALFYGEKIERVIIEGPGVIDGQQTYTLKDPPPDPFIAAEIESARAFGSVMKRPYPTEPLLSSIILASAKDVTIRGLTLLRARSWTLHLWDCDRVLIDGIRIDNSMVEGVNADGIDIDSSRDVRVSNVSISAGDDAICLKTTALYGKPRPLENVTVTNSVLSSSSAAFKIGTETHADIRNVVFTNSIIRGTNRALGIIVRDGATVSDVLFANLTIENARHEWFWWGNGDPFYFIVLKRQPDSRVGLIRDVRVSNVIARGMGTSVVQGFPGQPLRNIVFDGVTWQVSHDPKFDPRAVSALSIAHAAGVQLRHVQFSWGAPSSNKWRSAVVAEDAANLVLDGVSAAQAPTAPDGTPVLRLRNVDGAWIRHSRATAAGSSFVALEGPRTRGVRLEGNDLSAVKAPVTRAPDVTAPVETK